MSLRSAQYARLVLLAPAVLVLAGCVTADRGTERTATPEPPTATAAAPRAPVATAAAPDPATPSPAPEGPPPLSELVLSPDGLGTLSIGQPFDQTLARFDPQGCLTPENESYLELYPADDPIWEAWLPNYPQFEMTWGEETYAEWPFEPHHDEAGNVAWLRIRSPEIRTSGGIGMGSSEAELLAAHPDVTLAAEDTRQRLYALDGVHGRLLLDVASGSIDLPVPAGTIWDIRVQPLARAAQSLAYGDGGGFCAIGL